MFEALYHAIRRDAEPKEIRLDGRAYTTGKIHPVLESEPATLKVSTLTSLADYLNTNVDKHELSGLICHVEEPYQVSILSALTSDFAQRKCFIRAELHQLQLRLNAYLDGEEFNILLQSCFVEPDDPMQATDRGLVMTYAANVREVQEGVTYDDGVTQAVTVKKGIASVENATLPNPVTLRPYRTFTEVEQPASRFIFRAKEGPKFALIEADGGAWRSEAMKNIQAFMQNSVPGLNVIA
ncbi:hypothetical protein LJC15_04220 [Desulfovibrio sp. OttesenSCG-928-G11]|nr:hypothetical protein [Desulfovibrio sp. OttesenSCG-928-G11]